MDLNIVVISKYNVGPWTGCNLFIYLFFIYQ